MNSVFSRKELYYAVAIDSHGYFFNNLVRHLNEKGVMVKVTSEIKAISRFRKAKVLQPVIFRGLKRSLSGVEVKNLYNGHNIKGDFDGMCIIAKDLVGADDNFSARYIAIIETNHSQYPLVYCSLEKEKNIPPLMTIGKVGSVVTSVTSDYNLLGFKTLVHSNFTKIK